MPVLWTLWNFQETKMTSWLKNIYLIRNHHYNNNIFLKKYIEICKTNKQKNPRNIFQYAFFCLCFVLVVQSVSCVWLFAVPWTIACQASLSFTISWSLLKLMSIESTMTSNHLILCHPHSPPVSIFPSIKVFSIQSALYIRWPVCSYCTLRKRKQFRIYSFHFMQPS